MALSDNSWGPSIKYVTLFLANFYPPVTLRHTSRDPPESTSHISDSPRFLEGLVQKTQRKATLYKFCLNYSRGFLTGGFVRGVFCLEGFVWDGSIKAPYCWLPRYKLSSVDRGFRLFPF